MKSSGGKYPRQIDQYPKKTRKASPMFINSFTDTKEGMILLEKLSKKLKLYNKSAVVRKAIWELAKKHDVKVEESDFLEE